MATVQDSIPILRDAEMALRHLIERCLAEQKYGDVAQIAALAEDIAKLARQQSSPAPKLPSPTVADCPSKPISAPAQRSVGKKNTYPRFLRDGEKLVKIGWSKKAKKEYEHRTSREVPDILINAIRSKVLEAEPFAATDVIPLNAGSGADEIPDFQAYLALKWLQVEGVISKHGRDRYALVPGVPGSHGINDLWQKLPTLRGNRSSSSK